MMIGGRERGRGRRRVPFKRLLVLCIIYLSEGILAECRTGCCESEEPV